MVGRRNKLQAIICFIVFFIFASLSAAAKGDTSGIEAIVKFIVYAACILAILWFLSLFC